VLADDRCAVAEWTFRGTHTGPAMGVPPTGRRVEFSGVSIYEIEGGSFSRARIYYDTGTLADGLGFTGGRLPETERSRWAEWWETEGKF
jgi:predicted ester cyclase